MPATKFICPDGNQVEINRCLAHCPAGTRCLLHPTLSALAASTRRKLRLPSVTELIIGTREAYLKKTTNYAIDPQARLFALHGSAVHAAHAGQAEAFLSEARFYNDVFCGQIDLYGDVLGDGITTLADLKTVGSYKALKALGLESIDVETGEVYKTGDRKGQPKTRKEWVTGGRRDVREWALQLNAYRYLLEREGFPVGRMVVQLLVRDAGLEYANAVVETANMLALDTKNKVIGVFTISTGSLNASIIHPRDVFQRAILSNAASVILVHNHPSGDPTPSTEDMELTRRLVEAGKLLDIAVFDHVVIGDGAFVSLKEIGAM